MELAEVPESGIPDIGLALDAMAMGWVDGNQAYYSAIGFDPPWIAYLSKENGKVIGTCAFKGAPKHDVVEIAYATRPGMEGGGIATRMALELIHLARAVAPEVRITAQTLPELNASTRVLLKCGFTHVRNALDDEVGTVWEWELTR